MMKSEQPTWLRQYPEFLLMPAKRSYVVSIALCVFVLGAFAAILFCDGNPIERVVSFTDSENNEVHVGQMSTSGLSLTPKEKSVIPARDLTGKLREKYDNLIKELNSNSVEAAETLP